MKRFLFLAAATLVCISLPAQDKPARPRITGIDRVRIYVSDVEKSRAFYTELFGVRLKGGMCFDASRQCFTVGGGDQTIELTEAPTIGTKDCLAEIAFTTDDVEQMRNYLVAHGVTASTISRHLSPYDKQPYDAHFEILGPEGTPISFIQRFVSPIDGPPLWASWYVRIIHAGLVVRDRPAEDHLYKDILGFRPYWHGGRKDDNDDWVSLQVPNGRDWVEYMLNVPVDADKHTLGVMNHIALGVQDIRAVEAQLRKNGWTGTEQPKIGRGGKWQLNVYDPDDTRIEFMEFTPVQKPCCSEYTGPHPGLKQ